jgi:hypothetical protein
MARVEEFCSHLAWYVTYIAPSLTVISSSQNYAEGRLRELLYWGRFISLIRVAADTFGNTNTPYKFRK